MAASPKSAPQGSPGRRMASLLIGAAPWLLLAAGAAFWRRAPKPKPGLSKQVEAKIPETYERLEPGRGRLANAPHRIPMRGWRDVMWRTYREVSQDRLTVVAGSVTFYSLLAIFPAVGVFVALYGLFADVGQVESELTQIGQFVPTEALAILGDQMRLLATRKHTDLSVAFLISLLLSVWSANAGMKALFNGLNIAYDEEEKRNYFKLNGLTYAFTLGALVFVTVVVSLLVAAPLYMRTWGFSRFEVLWVPLRWLALLVFTAGAFAFVYRFGPCRAHARWRWVSAGGMFAALMWLGGSLGFSWYVNHIAHFDVTYGSLGAVIGFMMWIWFSVMVVLIGAELNAEIEHQTALDSTTGPAQPLGARGAAMADSVGLAFKLNVKQDATRIWGDVRRVTGRIRKPAKALSGPRPKG
ncbi:YihY/virulence factor BrkB family protein [Phenylobacterium sp.]|uniref:YihY/virulence factor BrkB family protein n=1 Tax=Phenylobacterium sp. TaxID=1871053 RepID=UPI002737569C|nr:YihY/virulence factor BrkB family protein [Phenylobacterium sp.]MDP3659483.1 YihY/virulence factor BrkB family protein [Phenylobacterium sp.]